MNPLINSDYPHNIRSLIGNRLLKFSKEQSKIVNGSFDFIGLNYDTSRYAAYAPQLEAGNASYLTDSLMKLLSTYKITHSTTLSVMIMICLHDS